MKIAILSDLHGNHYALDAVMEDPTFKGVEHLFILGDIVGYYYRPDLVLERLERFPFHLIQGNHDAMLSQINDEKNQKVLRHKYGSGLEKALDCLNEQQLDLLNNAPHYQSVKLDGFTSLLCHGSPWDRDLYIYPNASHELLDRCAAYEADAIFMGHTHYPMLLNYKGRIIANPGSVGQARDKGGRACWQVLDTDTRVLTQVYSQYDTSPLIEDIRRLDPEVSYLIKVLVRD